MSNVRHKSLLIGINYTGSQHQLKGCHSDVQNMAEFLSYRGYDSSPRNQVIMRDDLGDAYYPSGHNMLAAMDWLVSEPGTCNFLHYSGHGGQVPSDDYRASPCLRVRLGRRLAKAKRCRCQPQHLSFVQDHEV